MTEECIDRVGFVITRSRRGVYWDVTMFVRFDGHTGMRDVHYWNLSMTEASDVILANLEDYAPGTVRRPGAIQPVLWGSDLSGGDDDAA